MIELNSLQVFLIHGGKHDFTIYDEVKKVASDIAPLIKHLPSLAFYSYGISSALSGGAFAAPALVTLVYNVAYYNQHRYLFI